MLIGAPVVGVGALGGIDARGGIGALGGLLGTFGEIGAFANAGPVGAGLAGRATADGFGTVSSRPQDLHLARRPAK